jgi:hypothetical protein
MGAARWDFACIMRLGGGPAIRSVTVNSLVRGWTHRTPLFITLEVILVPARVAK